MLVLRRNIGEGKREHPRPNRTAAVRALLAATVCALLAAAALLAGCPRGTSGPRHPYVCPNGLVASGTSATQNEERCVHCNDGYSLEGVVCAAADYTCENGTPASGTSATQNEERCMRCNDGYHLEDAACAANEYTCENGEPVTEIVPDGMDGDARCGSCKAGFRLNEDAACIPDIDSDDDGLIDISSLLGLHNMRYNLAGTSYKSGESDAGTTVGAPTAPTAHCADATADGVYLCGYELTQNLDFDLDGDGATYGGTLPDVTLDEDDKNAVYFDTAAGGWLPIGTSTAGFAAIFEGNGFTIANLTARRNAADLGLFGAIGAGANIRNVGVVDALLIYYVESPTLPSTVSVGGLVGDQQDGSIIASYVSGNVYGGGANADSAGGLVGHQQDGSIIASYASGSVYGGDGGGDRAGGLVGNRNGGSIAASYASAAVYGGAGNNDRAGGLVGDQNGGSITTSYASGDVDGGDGGSDSVGGLVGDLNVGSVTASYASGDVDGGEGLGDSIGSLAGRQGSSVRASYGFGELTNGNSGSGPGMRERSPQPDGVTDAADLTADNAAICEDVAYTTQETCESATLMKTPGTFATNFGTCTAPDPDDRTAGVDYSAFTSASSCTSFAKQSADTWHSWNSASSNTLNAWIFAEGAAPKLRYADYDGSGDTYACALFLSSVACGADGAELPGQ